MLSMMTYANARGRDRARRIRQGQIGRTVIDLLSPSATDHVEALLADALNDAEVQATANGVWIRDLAPNGLERSIWVGALGDPLAERALAWVGCGDGRHGA